jgi:copper/silver efflux system protein
MVVPTTPTSERPIARLIAWSAANPFLTIITVLAFTLWGYYSLKKVPLDAIPDLSDTQVIIFSEWEGRSPNLVEDQVTYPLTRALLAAPQVKYVRGESYLGLSFISVIFADGTDLYWARSRVLEYLTTAQSKLPEGVSPALGPDATAVGWVFQYALKDASGKHSLADLRAFQDFSLRYWLQSVDGVAEVAAVGGRVREYQITLDPVKAQSYDLSIPMLIEAVRASNRDVGGRALEVAGFETIVRGRGYISGVEDLASIPVMTGTNGIPVYLRDVATIALGPAWDRGVAELDGEGETVGGIVVMRTGHNALNVINGVKTRLAEIHDSLPEGVELVVTYDRSQLIEESIATISHTLIEELIVVSLVIAVFLMHVRSALVPIIALPIAVVIAFVPMLAQHLTANIMSLGGIAVAIGAMVDASIIIIENIHRKLERWEANGRSGDRATEIVHAMQEVGPSIFFALLVITVSFLPVFTLSGTEGRLFAPLAYTKTYSMAIASLLAITLIPALAVLLVRGRIKPERDNPLNRWMIAAYVPVVRWVVRHRRGMIVGAIFAMAMTVPAFLRLGSEFMPPLNEGAILYMPTAVAGMSVTEAASVVQNMDARLKKFPEVRSVFGKMGSADTATDPAPMNMAEITVLLHPKDTWRSGMTWEKLKNEMDQELQYPGMPNVWWMPIQTRLEMLATGIRSPLGMKVYGPDLATIERTGIAIESALTNDERTANHTISAFAERATGGYYFDITVRREAAARYGVSPGEIQDTIEAAIGGAAVTETIEGRARFPVTLRYGRDFREDPDELKRILVKTKNGQVPLGQVADFGFVTGPMMIREEDGQLVGFVFIDVKQDAIGIPAYVEHANAVIRDSVDVPTSVRYEWTGQYQHFENAKARLKIVVPLTLFLVLLLIYLNTRSLPETVIIALAVPFSLIGAVWLLFALDYNMSVAVWVGLIALAGLDAETGAIMMLYLTLAYDEHRRQGKATTAEDLEEICVEGAARRLRPKLMTALVLLIGLLPVMWSSGTGADVMKRIAAPMVGGIITSFLLELTVYPAVFAMWKRRTITT